MRARQAGLGVGTFEPGAHNAITDVPGVRVGQTTLRREPDIHTGVTAIVPDRLPAGAGLFAGNGYGKLVGATQIEELGVVETPILLTATLSTFRVADALITWMLARDPGLPSVNPVVGECNDGWLSDMRSRPITPEHVFAALDSARTGPVEEGSVGAGTGTTALGFKAGIGTASRVVPVHDRPPVMVGALVQANFGGTLRVRAEQFPAGETIATSEHALLAAAGSPPDDGSCMIVVATDARLDSRQLTRVARRAVFALGRVGASYSHGSGDYGLAFSTAHEGETIPDVHLSPLFSATLDAVEEAVLNCLLAADPTKGIDGHAAPAWRP
ncbi:P1 family peptidase [Nonomuraea sp. NBC_01738]|uniref:P1 family peptidase n=1 Tax=Nonomuraea sp. NBC_01738 TaxID=2976003 RepID=UPI002E127991|nr:P1 family peptidase [Nonomuraea sp. NBC_01738]